MALGLEPESVRELLHERWDTYKHLFDPNEPHLLFIQGWIEGLMTGCGIRRRKGEAISRDDLFEALDYAVAIAQEWSLT